MTNEVKIAVLGGGQGAHAMTADMTLRGLEVNMFELPEYSGPLAYALKTGKIEISGLTEGVAEPKLITTDLEKALNGVSLIFLVVPTVAQKFFIKALKPHLRKGQTIVIVAGTFASLKTAPYFGDIVNEGNVLLAEISSLPYFARLIGPGRVRVTLKTPVTVAAFPGKFTPRVVEQVRFAYPNTLAMTDILEAALSNLNMLGPPGLLKEGAIEFAEMSGREYFVHGEGCSPSVSSVVSALDEERRAVGKALGYQLTTMVDILDRPGFGDEPSIYQEPQRLILAPGAGPHGLKRRYITEDMPFLLVPLAEVADLAGIDVPIVRSLITIACTLNDTDYGSEGRNLQSLGLSGKSINELKRFLANGSGVEDQKEMSHGSINELSKLRWQRTETES
ncbi:MAG: NAD/NADP octopine/nopaline dehydrogenase family protein [Pyrinomonadaceae bacterium]|jgi:opine dehydrogenase|nr:NAD/NADP octopine/nopaline dehydrogenase family protein [Pyrinomonadaceae bacterium]